MACTEPLSRLLGINISNLSPEELYFLEADLYTLVCQELKDFFKLQYLNYFRLMNFNLEKENLMLETSFIKLLIKDILLSEEYTLEGIARYTNSYEEVVQEILIGKNQYPSATLVGRLIELHRLIRKDLYQTIRDKVVTNYLYKS